MATVDKDFRVKHGLIVEGTNATVNGSNILTENSTDFLNDTVGALLEGSTQTNITIEYDETTNTLSIAAENGVADSTTNDLAEGTDNSVGGGNNLYFTDARARSAISDGDGISYSSETGTISADLKTDGGITFDTGQISVDREIVDTWYDANGAAGDVQDNLDTHINDTEAHGATGAVVGTTNTQTLTNKTISDSLKFAVQGYDYSTIHADTNNLAIDGSNNITLTTNTGAIILNPDSGAYVGSVSVGNTIATNSYVDNAVAGLDWKQAVNLKSVSSIDLLADLVGVSIDGHDPLTINDAGYRLLLTTQSVTTENGIYELYADGLLLKAQRSSDADVITKLIGAAVFVMEGTQFGGTSWVQNNHYADSYDDLLWTQFSGSGSVVAGTGITVDGLEISIDRDTVDTWYDASGSASDALSDANTYTNTTVENILDGTTSFTSLTLSDALIGTATQTLVDSTETVVDSWPVATYSSAKYLVQMKNGNDIEVIEVLVTVDGNNNVYLTEYADIQSNTQLGTTNATYLSGNVRLTVTSVNGTSVKVQKTLIEA